MYNNLTGLKIGSGVIERFVFIITHGKMPKMKYGKRKDQ